jgi:hypothetical protein
MLSARTAVSRAAPSAIRYQGATASRQRLLRHSAGLLFETTMAVAVLSSQGKRII